MNILVLHYYKSTIDGVMTSLIDAFFNMRENLIHDVQIKIFCPELFIMEKNDYYNFLLQDTQWYEYTNKTGLDVTPYDLEEDLFKRKIKLMTNQLTTSIPFLRFNRNFGDFGLFYFIDQEQRKFKADIVVCSARLIYEILMGVDIEIECKKLVVLDSLDTYKSKIGIFPDFDDLFDTMFKNSKVVQLSNPATFRKTRHEQIEYYHKFSIRRLNALKQSDILEDEYIFTRKKKKTKIEEIGYFENIGKGIFEHLWFDIPVHYKTDGMFTKDGLCHYLKLFDIDAEKEQTLKIKKSDIIDKLSYKMWDGLHLREKGVTK